MSKLTLHLPSYVCQPVSLVLEGNRSVNGGFLRIWNKTIVAYFKKLSEQLRKSINNFVQYN